MSDKVSIAVWIIDGNHLDVDYSKATNTYYASGSTDFFRGVCLGSNLQELYEEILAGSKLLEQHRREQPK